jgi:hypothetical protein
MKRCCGYFLLLVSLGAMLAGCAGAPVGISDAQRAELRSAGPIRVVYYGPAGPGITQATNVVKFHFSMGLAGWGTPAAVILKENGIEDPMIAVRRRLTDRLAAEGGFKNLRLADAALPLEETSVADLQKRFGRGLHMQIYPTAWTVVYYVSNWSRYYMMYGAIARVVRADDGAILWSGQCSVRRDDGDKAPTIEQLMGNRAALLKVWARDASLQCADQLADAYLGGPAR